MPDQIIVDDVLESPPEPPPRGATLWMKDNLFSSVASSVLSIVFLGVAIWVIYGLATWVLDPARRWDALTTNMRLLMVQAYPSGAEVNQMHRIWISVGLILVTLAASLAVFGQPGKVSRKHLGKLAQVVGAGFVVFGGSFVLWAVLKLVLLSPEFDLDALVGTFTLKGRIIFMLIGAIGFAIGRWLSSRGGDAARRDTIPTISIVGGAMVLILIGLWTVKLPVVRVDGSRIPLPMENIASTTAGPWSIIIGLMLLAYPLSRWLRRVVGERVLRKVLLGTWALMYPVVVLAIMRDPAIDYHLVWAGYVPFAVGFAVVGAPLLMYLAGSKVGEAGRVVSALLVVVALISFIPPIYSIVGVDSIYFLVRFLLLMLAFFAVLAPTFGGGGGRRYAILWLAAVGVVTLFVAWTNTVSSVEVPGSFFTGGLALTFIVAISSIILSLPIGVILALARTSTMPLFRMMSTVYIEIIRGVPLITWLIVAFTMLPVALPAGVTLGGVMRAIIMITFFSAAYLAENVRGGLQSISKGQKEAAQALGMNTVQMTVFITLPQALRAVIPALVGQVIALFKDTSLLTIVGLFDFLHIARSVIPNQTNPFNFLGTIKEDLVFAAFIYWIFTFTTSRVSLRLEKKLGVGER